MIILAQERVRILGLDKNLKKCAFKESVYLKREKFYMISICLGPNESVHLEREYIVRAFKEGVFREVRLYLTRYFF